jgi:hypothetical protein
VLSCWLDTVRCCPLLAGVRVVCPSAGFFLSSLRTPLLSPLLSSLLPPSSPSLRAVSFASPFSRSYCLLACLLACNCPRRSVRGVDLPDYLLLLLDLSLPRSCILRLSLSVSACACPSPPSSSFLASCSWLCCLLCMVSFRFAPPRALLSMAAATQR